MKLTRNILLAALPDRSYFCRVATKFPANSPSQLTTAPARHATVQAMVLDGDKLRKEATEARQMADAASNQHDRDFWLRISEGWSELAREADAQKGKKQ